MCDISITCVCVVFQDHDGLIERWKRKNMDNILDLHNKSPVWNDGEYTGYPETTRVDVQLAGRADRGHSSCKGRGGGLDWGVGLCGEGQCTFAH